VFACVDAYARSLSLRGKIGQLLMANIAPSGAGTQDLVTRYGLGGVVVATGRDGVLQQTDVAKVATAEGLPVFVSVDEEGGRVQRLRSLPKLPSARQMAATQTPDQVYATALAHGRKMRALGVNVDFAPVVDVSDQPASSVIGDRAFSNDPAVVVRYAGRFADGLRDAGVLPVFKHFPGHGHASGDTHKTAATTPPLAQLRTRDLVPYEQLLGVGPAGVMIGHLDVPGLTTGGEPTSISPATIDGLLRRELGFDGLVMTDELGGMQAIAGRVSLPEAARRTLAAGSDVVLWSDETQVPSVLDHLERSVRDGTLPEAVVDGAMRRVLLTKVYLGLIC
jgi:beta-N-acetylhexosaminidase